MAKQTTLRHRLPQPPVNNLQIRHHCLLVWVEEEREGEDEETTGPESRACIELPQAGRREPRGKKQSGYKVKEAEEAAVKECVGASCSHTSEPSEKVACL